MSAPIESVSLAPSVSSGASAVQSEDSDEPGFGFGDLLDVINPLQHIPVIGTIYRAVTHDALSPTAEIFGGALFGGIVGAMASMADVVFAQATGKDMGDTVFAWLGLEGGNSANTRVAETELSGPAEEPEPDSTVAARASLAYRNASALRSWGGHGL
jgi:hypothetical protein